MIVFYLWLARVVLPKRLVSYCGLQILIEATSGKYSKTIVNDLAAMEAVKRYDRIHGIEGSGKDEFYDSNRGRK